MADMEAPVRPELIEATDETIEDAVRYADPMVLRGWLYQLTGDPEVVDMELKKIMMGFLELPMPARDEDVAMLQRKAADFLKAYRDTGAGPVDIGPRDRLPTSLSLIFGEPIPEADLPMYLQELALDPWARSLRWPEPPKPGQLEDFNVAIIGAGMGGLNVAVHLKRAGIDCTVIEKNSDVGGTWHENRYPGARVDSPSRFYNHLFGADFPYPNPFCDWRENEKYFRWVADSFDLRGDVVFDTEVRSLTWDEGAQMWEIAVSGPEGERVMRARAVITAVGFLNRPHIPDFDGRDDFQGPSWHTSRWPEGTDLRDKRVAVIGTGCTGYQMIPELALEAGQVTVFQRTPQWVCAVPGYRSPFPSQVPWLDRNMPYHVNFMRARTSYNAWFPRMTTFDLEAAEPYTCSDTNLRARDACVEFLERKLDDPELVKIMTPKHPVWSARAVVVDTEYSILDALGRDNVTLVTSGIRRIARDGVETEDGELHKVDAIVYATGFQATDYLYPMEITGRGGRTIGELWRDGGARAYRGTMMPGFPNLWSIYGPNTNGALAPAALHEMMGVFALRCIERLVTGEKHTVDVKEDAYWRYNREVDELNLTKVWAHPSANNYYWSEFGRSITQCPYSGPEMWRFLNQPDFDELEFA